ncbi:AraC family transcriptional regulator [Tichowtungia aerotolerans]|uniref:Helix-turn-helix domain-containing protein n=1 Tax=Tichowtungia aerotolerans TaxID=2697043 RepID=A0A6P1M821_9BACT|nr:AraC family transcriptional regulator [Tichowtungia aerotolerans]QHI70021.1 helix-turn-helix domain-containing protein [Tichowtungia aerotolerans]
MKSYCLDRLFFRNASIVENRPSPGIVVPEYYTFLLILDGEYIYMTGTETIRLQPGDLLCVFENRPFTLRGLHYKYLFVSFNGPNADGFLRNIGITESRFILKAVPRRIHSLMHEITKAMPTRQTENPYFFISRIAAIGEVIWQITYPLGKQKKPSYPQQMKTILEKHHYQTGVGDIADQLQVCTDTLRKACLKETGLPANEYLIHLRIERAKELLRKTSYKLSYIAQAAGYNDEKHFLKAFKKLTGKTPSEWRNTAQHS